MLKKQKMRELPRYIRGIRKGLSMIAPREIKLHLTIHSRPIRIRRICLNTIFLKYNNSTLKFEPREFW
jgi:hypothetical protein